jgi:DNA-binding transcriptional LysR family regulator
VVVTEQVTGALLADDHPLADRDMITLADLEGLDVIMPSAQVNPITYQRTYETLARLGRRRPPRVMVENPAEGLSLIAAGIAFGLGFESLRRNPLNMLRLVPVEGLAMPMPVYCYAPRWSEREFVPTFVQYVLEEAAQ